MEPRNLLLPSGMRDLLPREARSRRKLARTLLEHVELHGYSLVTLPAFEIAEVLERGLGTLDPRDVLRFVEPESGEVAALRPDMTPQIARMVATRMSDMPRPIRLAYEGTVLRRRQERARRHRQIPQAGVELLGIAGPEGDRELLSLAASSVRAAGIERFVIDIGHAEIVRSLLAAHTPDREAALRDALSVKDARKVVELSSAEGVSKPISAAISALPSLRGDRSVLSRAHAIFDGTPAAKPLAELRSVIDDRLARELGDALAFDLGEVRGFAYYTGLFFHVLAEGPGEAIGGGGRYDELLARFGAPMPAAGFALDLDHLAWARREAGIAEEEPPHVVVEMHDEALAIAKELRAHGVAASVVPSGISLSFAKAWSHPVALSHDGSAWCLTRLDSGGSVCAPAGSSAHEIATWAASFVRDAAAGLSQALGRR